MKFTGILIALALTLPASALAQPLSPTEAAAKIDALFSAGHQERPGCAVGVSLNGETVIEKAFGFADLERDVRNTTATVFEIGSVSKQFAAAAVLLLERDGKLKLSDDIRKYLPEMPEYDTPITIEMLLNHTSGLRDWGSVANAMGKPRGDRTFSNAEVLDIAARQTELNYRPGDAYSYTNTGYNLATIIVERVSGQSLMAFTQERLFAPLGMTSAQWRDDYNRIVKNRAMAYVPDGVGYKQAMPFMNVYGNGGLMMTIADLTRWNEAMMADVLGLRSVMEMKGILADGREIPYARGVNVLSHNGATEVSHSGATGGYAAWLARYPDRKLSIAMICNAPPPPMINPEVLGNLFLGEEPDTPAPAGLPDPSSYAGRFVSASNGAVMNISADAGALRINGRALPRLTATTWRRGPDRLTFTSADQLRIDSGDGNQSIYVRTPAATLTVEQLGDYTGSYTSAETMATYRVALEDSALKVRIDGWPDTTLTLTPSYKDAFTSGGMLVRFRRDADGKINEMSLGDSRMWDLRAGRVK